jgi:hypothetical protein
MALIDKIFSKKKSLSELSKVELRKQEILLTKQRDRLFKRVEQIAGEKQKIFQLGSTQKSPELRKALAQDFELKAQEQVMAARELTLRSKELLTVNRLRVVKENSEAGKATGRLNITDKDVARISGWLDDDGISQDIYQERLDSILDVGRESDRESIANAGLTETGQELMNLWDQIDKGKVKPAEAFEAADRAVRQRNAPAADKEM